MADTRRTSTLSLCLNSTDVSCALAKHATVFALHSSDCLSHPGDGIKPLASTKAPVCRSCAGKGTFMCPKNSKYQFLGIEPQSMATNGRSARFAELVDAVATYFARSAGTIDEYRQLVGETSFT